MIIYLLEFYNLFQVCSKKFRTVRGCGSTQIAAEKDLGIGFRVNGMQGHAAKRRLDIDLENLRSSASHSEDFAHQVIRMGLRDFDRHDFTNDTLSLVYENSCVHIRGHRCCPAAQQKVGFRT